MRSFRQILWRHVWRYGFVTVVLGAIGLVLINWAYDHAFPSKRQIAVTCGGWLTAIGIATVWNAWAEWRHASDAKFE
jgi:multisubunit Na+/H+ antiporter MnhB subunit